MLSRPAIEPVSWDANLEPIMLPRPGARRGGEDPRLFGVPAMMVRCARGREIFGQDEPAELLYKVVSGVVRTCKVLCDGRRQVAGFYWPGEVFGIESDEDDAHSFAAEAVTDVRVVCAERGAIEGRAGIDTDAAIAMVRVARRELARAHDRIVTLGRTCAMERITRFLHEMLEHSDTVDHIELPMSREDIADYLGLTIETVSRTLSAMDARGIISLASARRIDICDPAIFEGIDG